jgi:hypothetical protein
MVERDALARLGDHLVETGDHLLWRAGLNNGRPHIANTAGSRNVARLVFEVFHGALPDGFVVRATCDEPERCVAPSHLEALSPLAVRAERPRKQRCLRGHDLDDGNTYVAPDGGRRCRACARLRDAAHRRRRREAAAAAT